MKHLSNLLFSAMLIIMSFGCSSRYDADVVIRNGMLYDGSGAAPVAGDLAITADTISAVGDLSKLKGRIELDARGKAIAPGFINMLSWSNESLIEDGRAESTIRQGVTLEVMGEGSSMGPLTDQMKKTMKEEQGAIRYDITWTSFGEYMEYLERKGISTNVASFVGATTIRIYVLGYEDRAPNEAELMSMKELVRAAMEEGALGVGSSLIYAPAFYASTDELIELCSAAAPYGGMYITHMRSEGNRLLEAFGEVRAIARNANIRAEVYHLKAAGTSNWEKMDVLLNEFEKARASGLDITADMYTYTAGATGLDAAMPPWCQEGGLKEWINRLNNPELRRKITHEMKTPTTQWENLYLAAGSAERVLLVEFKQDSLRYLTGKTLAEVAALRNLSPEETAIQLVIDNDSDVGTVYFMMSEDNLKKQMKKPWVSFGSDAASQAPNGNFLKSNPHPRAYGNFARLLGKYVREEGVLTLEDAIRRLTSLPAERLGIKKRGGLKVGHFGDVVVFDPMTIADRATYEHPHQYAVGVTDVFVNGVQVLKEGEHTGATPGRFVRGPGWKAR